MESLKQRSANDGPQAHHLFVNKVLLAHNHVCVYMLSVAALALQAWRRVVRTETGWSAKPKIFMLGPLQERTHW